MTTDKADFNRTYPASPMYYDRDFNYRKDRAFWLRFLIGLYAGSYIFRKYYVEQDRARMNARLEGYPNELGHHFHNRGGVVVKKDFVGFEKYFQNGTRQIEWLYKVYPNQMNGSEE
jgi:hypothetical protein